MFSSHRRIRPNTNWNDRSDGNPTIYRVSLPIASRYFGLIIGAKGVTLKQIKSETNTKITMPQPNETGPIEIAGESKKCVDAARRKIETIVESNQYETRINHLINVRISDGTIKNNFVIFMEEVLADDLVDGLTKAMFMRPTNLHISFNAMRLSDENGLARATEALKECVEEVIVPVKNEVGKIEVKISGVRVFDDVYPMHARVVFARIESAALQKIADGIRGHFVAKGLSKRQPYHDGVIMHMTLFNTFNVFGGSSAGFRARVATPLWRRSAPRKYLDVRPMLAKYANYEFGTQEITEMALSSIEEEDSDGTSYKVVASVTF